MAFSPKAFPSVLAVASFIVMESYIFLSVFSASTEDNHVIFCILHSINVVLNDH